MDKIVNQKCPRCLTLQMNVYYQENSDTKIGAWCKNCNLRGFYSEGKLETIEEMSLQF